MNTIKINNETFEVLSFSKNTTFNGDTITGSGSMSIHTTDISKLQEIAQNTVNTIQIYHDEDCIYDLADANGKIISIDEYLSDSVVNININLRFDFGE